MATNAQYSTTSRNTCMDAFATNCNSGYVDILDGVQPANGDTAITTQNVLASVALPATCFGASSSGTITANAITGVTGSLNGTATWARLYKSDHTTALGDCTVGTTGTNITLDSVNISTTATVTITGMSLTMQSHD